MRERSEPFGFYANKRQWESFGAVAEGDAKTGKRTLIRRLCWGRGRFKPC